MSNQFGMYSEQFTNNYSKQQNQEFTAAFSAITDIFLDAMNKGMSVEEPDVQDAVRQHYEFCSQFWKPNREAYTGLALSYILPSPYRDSYEEIAPGLGKYHYDAIVVWANNNLD
jgi:hypothetical protein